MRPEKGYFKNLLRGKFDPDRVWPAYEKYKDRLPANYNFIITNLKEEDLLDYAHAAAAYFYKNVDNMVLPNGMDKEDLNALINFDVNRLVKGEFLGISNFGLNFLNYYNKKERLKSAYYTKKAPLEQMRELPHLFRCVEMTLEFNYGLDSGGLQQALRVTGNKYVSNFRPATAAFLYQRYGVEKTKDPVLYFRDPSTGWLSRMLGSYYIAIRNPQLGVRYYGTDPNFKITETASEVVEFLKGYGGLCKVRDWDAQTFSMGSEVEEAKLSDTIGHKFHVSFTSPPYYTIEKYLETVIVNNVLQFSESDYVTTDTGEKRAKRLKPGETLYHEDRVIPVFDVRNLGQSVNRFQTVDEWNEGFLRKTIQNQYYDLKPEGYMIINIANVSTHMTLENDTVRIAQEEGFELEKTWKYKLHRIPLANNKFNPRMKLEKKNFEPIFVFKKK